MTGRRRRELSDSVRLLAAEERWILRDFALGTLAVAGWTAGTALLATRVADASGVPLGAAAGQSPSAAAVALFAVLWLLVPAAAALVRLRGSVRNIRGNVEQYYRFDHPAALLAPPGVLAAVATVIALAPFGSPWYASLLLLPAGLFCLVRALAFSYRVYAFSYPLVVQAGVVASTAAALGGAYLAVAAGTGRWSLAEAALSAVGAPASLVGDVSVGSVAVPGPTLAMLAPVAFVAAYAFAQSVAALVVRLHRPAIDRATVRTGQRYPPFLDDAAPAETSAEPVEHAGGGASADATDADGSDAGAATATDPAREGEGSEDGESGDAAVDEDDLDAVGHTRVFTPPDDGGASFDAPVGAEDGTGGSGGDPGAPVASGADEAAPGETRAASAARDGGDADGSGPRLDRATHCEACGESFTVDAVVRFCPNCGASLDGA